ncbi:MAG: DUF4398 domain-containing protein [Pseudomonadota bacterium]|nr:DUF4398 domain-containing protein [Pseudomonadota bacterium]
MRLLLLLSLLPLSLSASGCALRASYFVLDAERKFQGAVEAGGDERAVYETTLAREYLWKAKEEVNSSDYGAVEQLCKKSVAWSAEAYEKSADVGPDLEKSDEFVPETKPEEEKKPEGENTLDDIDLDDL